MIGSGQVILVESSPRTLWLPRLAKAARLDRSAWETG